MRLPVKYIPEEIMLEYNLAGHVYTNYVLVEIRKGMYGLPQAGKIANDRLVKHITKEGYSPCTHIPGFFCHRTRPIAFTLLFDDFLVRYKR